MEVATDNYGQHNVHLIEKIQNGLNESYRKNASAEIKPSAENNELNYDEGDGMYASSFMRQWCLLTMRVIRCYSRDRALTLMRPVIHFSIAVMIGTLYFNIGDDASMIFNNFRYVFMTLMFLMYTAFCSMSLLCKYRLPFQLWQLISIIFFFKLQFHWKCQLWLESTSIVGTRKKPTTSH